MCDGFSAPTPKEKEEAMQSNLSSFHRSRHGSLQPVGFDWLNQVINHAIPHEGSGHPGIRVGREDNERDVGVLSLKIIDGFDAIDLWHADVTDHGIQH